MEDQVVEKPSSWCRTLINVSMIIIFCIFVIGSSSTKKMLLIAALMSAIWVAWYGYDYNSEDQILIGGRLNVMTWVIWTVGLVAMATFYMSLKNNEMSFPKRLWLTGVIWCLSIVGIEWIGYNLCNIKCKSNYPGLLGLKLMHGPWYLKFYYLTAWALFLTFLNVW